MKTVIAVALVAMFGCGPVVDDPCPGEVSCGSGCAPAGSVCCNDGTYCNSYEYCDGSLCVDDGFVECTYASDGQPDGYECPESEGCASTIGYCN
jgi:hypothetical protein